MKSKKYKFYVKIFHVPLKIFVSGGDQTVLTSPQTSSDKYRHNSDCTWNIFSTRGQLELTFTRFNLEWASNCRDKDFVFLNQAS